MRRWAAWLGRGVAKAGFGVVIWPTLATTGAAIGLSPVTGLPLAMARILAESWLALRATPLPVDRRFRVLHFISSSLRSLAHGGNDAHKTMEIITVLLLSQARLTGGFHVPLSVALSCPTAMARARCAAAGASCAPLARELRT